MFSDSDSRFTKVPIMEIC